MYSQHLAVAVKSSGKVLRELQNQVFLPFNTEYSVFIKNKNSVRASVKVEIDGTDVTEGVSLVVDPNDEIELERFIKNGNLDRGNRFKFIERSSSVAKHRGIKVDDGLIRVEFQFEKPQERYLKGYLNPLRGYNPSVPYDPWKVSPPYEPLHWWSAQPFVCGSVGQLYTSSPVMMNNISTGAVAEVGITTPGSISDQEFNTVSSFPLESQKHVIIMQLLGEHQGKSVVSVVTSRAQITCQSCGHRNRSTVKFCLECGTSVNII